MTATEPLFGDPGTRVAVTEYGVDWPVDAYLNQRGKVTPAQDREHADRMAEHRYWGPDGPYHGFVVARAVVTYTTAWERVS